MDPNRRVRSELSTDEVAGFNENFKAWAAGQREEHVRFLGAPRFDERFDEATGEVVFESPWIIYRVTAAAGEGDEIIRQYHEFSDWYIQLNARLNPGYMQACARMVVNAALAKRNELPREVHLTLIKSRFPPQKATARTQHQLVRRLVQSDRDRVAQTDQFIAIFQPLVFKEYQRRTAP